MNTVGTFKGYTLVEEELFTQQIEALGGAGILDRVLMAVSWALCNNPTHFDPVPMHLKLRIAKTREHVTEEGVTIPALRIHFVIEEVVEGYHVVLKSIEAM